MNIIITIMIFVGILLVVSTISNSNMFVNAQQQSLKYKHQNKELFLFLMKKVDQEMNQYNLLVSLREKLYLITNL
mgnify:CR=1 FL=1